MSGLIYSAAFESVAITAAQDLFEILAPADAVLELLSCGIGQTSDSGDAAEELLLTTLRMVGASPTSGSGGSTPTPRPHNLGGPASGCTVEANNTTQLLGGTNVVLRSLVWNVRQGEYWTFTPEERIYISPSTRLLWELEAAPADSLTVSGWICWRELGG